MEKRPPRRAAANVILAPDGPAPAQSLAPHLVLFPFGNGLHRLLLGMLAGLLALQAVAEGADALGGVDNDRRDLAPPAEPQREDSARLPCLATGTPQAAATSPEAVEIL